MKNNMYPFVCDRCGMTTKIEARFYNFGELTSTSTFHGLCTKCEQAVRQNEENQEMFMELPPVIYYHLKGCC